MRISDWSSDVCSSDLLEPAAPLRDRASEAAFLMAEQLRFQQAARDRAAVYRNEAVMRPLAFVMEGCRNDFLAAAGRPGDHAGGVRTRNLSAQVSDPAHSVPITNDDVHQKHVS